MSLQRIKQGIQDQKFICPQCEKPIQQYDKFTEMTASVWDGAGDSDLATAGSKVTLICGACDWKERTEYWSNYLRD